MFGVPQVIVRGDPDASFTYIPSHLHYMILELLKNAMRASLDTHRQLCAAPPVVTVIVAHGEEDVTIKVSDEGGMCVL